LLDEWVIAVDAVINGVDFDSTREIEVLSHDTTH
jgi:hypothetical protein